MLCVVGHVWCVCTVREACVCGVRRVCGVFKSVCHYLIVFKGMWVGAWVFLFGVCVVLWESVCVCAQMCVCVMWCGVCLSVWQ